MTPEQQQAIKTHLDAISVILYDNSNPDAFQTLEDIELAVRDQVLTHVTPHIGFFLSAQQPVQKPEESRP
ncbi:hypothetical protein [Microcoleus sp. Pol17_C1]|uniref:hypothetical protein n=1 Tax=Microcoleus sp. Pol17_C1 TaxID=2818881 RepID=UPI002FD04F86